jgi:hypothetical protein
VVTPGGQPVAGALIELWTQEGRVTTTATDNTGRFTLPEEAMRLTQRLTITQLGYRVRSLPVADVRDGIRIELDPMPIALPDLTVTAAKQLCPNSESAEARQLWRAASSQYSQESASRARSAEMLRIEEEQVPNAAVGWVSEERLRPVTHAWAGGSATRQHGRYIDVNTRIAAGGYAFRTDMAEPPWRFPALDERDAHHFASELFGTLHSFSFFDDLPVSEEKVLVYCPRDRTRPSIEGILRFAADSTFLEAEWTVITPRPVRRAGGHVLFSRWSSNGAELPHLLPERGTFWVQHPHMPDRYSQRHTIYSSWRIGSDGAFSSLMKAFRR